MSKSLEFFDLLLGDRPALSEVNRVSASAASGRLGASIGAAQSFKEFGDMVGPLPAGVLTQMFGIRVGFVTRGSVEMILLVMLAQTGGLRPGQSPVGIS